MASKICSLRPDASLGVLSVRSRCSLSGAGLQKMGHYNKEDLGVVCGVSSPYRPDTTLRESQQGLGASKSVEISMTELTKPVLHDLDQLNSNLRNVVGERHPMLMAAADQIFGAGGKKLRPVIVFLIARATMAVSGSRLVRRVGPCRRVFFPAPFHCFGLGKFNEGRLAVAAVS